MKKTVSAKNLANRRLLRAARTRRMQMHLGVSRLLVYISGQHTYAQILSPEAKVVASASTVEKEMRQQVASGGNMAAAAAVGTRLAEKVRDIEIEKLAFDRGGRRYTGRVQALADAARAGGLKF
ncbi:MAG: 50S ribosomal protein L18 [Proteobacteria bacterium]|nr:50S ribosomal protein L18 [Pseudomonadota bacterium]MCH9757776.1 50S ribosomal protein L18 [Pseudomonadota bacterium]